MSELLLTDAYEIAAYIKAAEKQTPIKLYIKGNFENPAYEGLKFFGSGDSYTVFGDASAIYPFLEANKDKIKDQVMEYDRRNSAIPLLDTTKIDARIEPGSFIRDHVTIGKSAVIMMGAVINIGAVIGEGTMIDMGAVVGARGTIGKNCHIGAGAVVAGVLEPPSKSPVIIEDGVLVGANAVIIEGVHIGEGAVVAAGAIVLEDVPANAVVAGSPAKIVKMKDEKTSEKTQLLADLRD
ncbi:MAG: 2,3,4,5-tetrahydropyridine-2,6-dicarboxylate N-acetyltransferase [Trichococcus flocculiformis]